MTDFSSVFGHPAAISASAPGRVNLIGEHTDYNGGYVMPIAVPLFTDVHLGVRDDDEVHAFSLNLPADRAHASYRRGAESRRGSWIDYVQGITQALDERGHRVPGFNLHIASRVPVGSGLASSAALEIAVLRALRAGCGLRLDDVELALVAHRAETHLVGAPVGIMDQMAASLADEHQALFIDTQTLDTRRVAMPDGVGVAVIDSGITHSHATGEYRVRRTECERAAALLGVERLRALTSDHLPRVGRLTPPLNRRARHVITENARVLAAIDAMQSGDMATLGQIWVASHTSMRDDFDTSLPEIDALVEIACAQPEVYGARLTGGGFGGAIVVLLMKHAAAVVSERIRSQYVASTARGGRVLVPPDV